MEGRAIRRQYSFGWNFCWPGTSGEIFSGVRATTSQTARGVRIMTNQPMAGTPSASSRPRAATMKGISSTRRAPMTPTAVMMAKTRDRS